MRENIVARPWLTPLVPLYRMGLALYTGLKPVRRLRWPVISIGNLSTGGAGKTPLTIALAQTLMRCGLHVDVLSRGYGRSRTTAMRVDLNGSADEFGDEPILIARETGAPVYVAARRYEAGLLAEREAASVAGVHLLDDGFQHRQLHRDVDILLLNARDLKDELLPAGNLREPLNAFERSTVLAVGADEPEVEQYLHETILVDRNPKGSRWIGPVWRIDRRMDVPAIKGPVVAFCGIARPEQFFKGLLHADLHVAECIVFSDHHRYSARELERLCQIARKANAVAFVTTEKDQVRLGGYATTLTASCPLETVRLRIEIEDEDTAIKDLLGRLTLRLPESQS
jgi:tetraacyldisaccharide 4'-kinase